MRLIGANRWCFFLMVKRVGVLGELLLLDLCKEHLDLILAQISQNIILTIWYGILISRLFG